MRRADEVIDIGPKERAVLVGHTQSGKSTLAKVLLPQFPYVTVIDPKGKFSLPNERISRTPSEFKKQPVRPYEPQIYQPTEHFWDVDDYDDVFKHIYQRQNTTVYITEVYGVVRGPQVPLYYRAILTRGAELHIRTISETQRPSRIPLEILSESDHYIMYRLQNGDDRKRMAEYMGEAVLEPLTEEYSFYYHEVGGGPVRSYKLELEGDQ